MLESGKLAGNRRMFLQNLKDASSSEDEERTEEESGKGEGAVAVIN